MATCAIVVCADEAGQFGFGALPFAGFWPAHGEPAFGSTLPDGCEGMPPGARPILITTLVNGGTGEVFVPHLQEARLASQWLGRVRLKARFTPRPLTVADVAEFQGTNEIPSATMHQLRCLTILSFPQYATDGTSDSFEVAVR